METPANCATGDAQHVCGFLVRVLTVVTQDKHLALFARQGLENGEDSSAHLGLVQGAEKDRASTARLSVCVEKT